jgi:hypothetical protein
VLRARKLKETSSVKVWVFAASTMDDWDHATLRRMEMSWGQFYRKWKLDSILSERIYPATVPYTRFNWHCGCPY